MWVVVGLAENYGLGLSYVSSALDVSLKKQYYINQ